MEHKDILGKTLKLGDAVIVSTGNSIIFANISRIRKDSPNLTVKSVTNPNEKYWANCSDVMKVSKKIVDCYKLRVKLNPGPQKLNDFDMDQQLANLLNIP